MSNSKIHKRRGRLPFIDLVLLAYRLGEIELILPHSCKREICYCEREEIELVSIFC